MSNGTYREWLERMPNKELAAAVVRQLGGWNGGEVLQVLADVARGGADTGWSGFTYYWSSENYRGTVDFYRKHRKLIIDEVERMAEDLGEDPVSMVRNFRCLSNTGRKVDDPAYTFAEVSRTLYASAPRNPDNLHPFVQIANALAWFALEQVAYAAEE